MVLAALWILPVLLVSYVTWPDLDESIADQRRLEGAVERTHVEDDSPSAHTYEVVDPKTNRTINLRRSGSLPTADELNKLFARLDQETVVAARQALRVKRRASVAWTGVAWLVPVFSVYVLGWAIGWVRRLSAVALSPATTSASGCPARPLTSGARRPGMTSRSQAACRPR